MKKGKKGYWLGIFLILTGVCIFQYPKMTDFLFRQEVKEKKEHFFEEKNETKDQAEALYQELTRRNEALYLSRKSGVRDPFLYAQEMLDLSAYGIRDGVVGFLKIDKMGVELPIYLGATEEHLALGAAQLTETSYPIGGENTNSVIAAHRGYSKTAMFRDIERLEMGDEVLIENFRETLHYEVSEIVIVDPTETDRLLIRPGEDLVTLLTCHPYGSNAKRYLVYCRRSG